MKSAWAKRDAEAAVARYADALRDVALRVYTTRLLGADPKLVLHGGGNTSVKTKLADLNGDNVDVLCVKGSGWDMTGEGRILHRHGIFTCGADAREAYERMIEMVTLAEDRLKRGRRSVFATAQLPQQSAALADVAPVVRGACSLKDEKTEGAWKR